MSGAPPNSTPPPGVKPLWGGSTSSSGRPAGLSPSSHQARGTRQARLEPLSRRLLQAAGALSLLLILVVANSLLSDGGASPFDPSPIAAAAERTEGVSGLRFTMKVLTTSETHPPEIATATGAFNLQTHLAHALFTVPTSAGGRTKVEAVIDEEAIYIHSPEFRGKLPEGREWAKMDPSALAHNSEDSLPAEGPGGSLGLLGADESARLAGRRRVRGVPVRRYLSSFEMNELAAKLRAQGEDVLATNCERMAPQVVGPVQAEALVDGKGLLRRIQIRMASTATGTLETVDTRMDFFDFGAQPRVLVPPEGRVFDMTPLLEKQQEVLGQTS